MWAFIREGLLPDTLTLWLRGRALIGAWALIRGNEVLDISKIFVS